MADSQPNTPQQPQGRDTVTIACKLPHGIVLRAFRLVETQEVTPQGSRTIKKAERLPGEFTIHGNSVPENGPSRQRIEFGFALTPGCPKDLWERWLEANKDSPMVQNGLIFAHGSERSAVAEAREKEAVRSGFERLDPTKLPGKIKKADPVAA